MLDELVAIFGGVPGRHFALVDEERISRLRAMAFGRNYGIDVIRYKKSAANHPEVLDFVRRLRDGVTQEQRKQLASISVQVAGDPSSAALAQALDPLVRVDVLPAAAPAAPVHHPQAVASNKTPAATQVNPLSNLRDYCLANFGTVAWQTLEGWYGRLDATPAGSLLRANLDRESARNDLSRDIWSDFLQILMKAAPSPDQPFDALQRVIETHRGRFLLRGKRLETNEPLCRYMRLRHFTALGMAAVSGGSHSAALRQVEAEDSNAVQIGELLLGKPGGPSWCTTPSFASGRNAESIARDLWDGAAPEPLVEIRYAPDTLAGDDYLRVATVIDMYTGRVDEANILKPAPGQGDWCWTVRIQAAPAWTPLAPAAVHPPLKLAGARAQTLQVRMIL
jgi:hypothetical protein